MPNNLTDFLIDLGENPAKLNAFQKNPDRTMHDAGLSKDQRSAVVSGQGTRIARALVPEGAAPASVIWVRPLEVLRIGAPA